MKNIILTLLLFPFLGMAQGITFNDSQWDDILKKAKAENKIIFVDAYATWCGPCKQMAKNIFTDESVGKFFNESFINAKIDMEMGEGETIAEKYSVQAYPTLLFIDGNGELLHKAVGYKETDELTQLGIDAQNPTKQIGTLIKKYNNGDRDVKFLLNLSNAAVLADDANTGTYVDEYLKTQPNLSTIENIELMMKATDMNSKSFQFIYKNEKEVGKFVEPSMVKEFLDKIILSSVVVNSNKSYDENIKIIKTRLDKIRPQILIEYLPELKMYVAKELGNDLKLATIIAEIIDSKLATLTSAELNERAWGFFENVDNKELLLKALKWGLKSITLDSNFFNNDTVAKLYYKLGDKKNAKIYAKKSIKMGKEKGEDTQSTEKLLEKL